MEVPNSVEQTPKFTGDTTLLPAKFPWAINVHVQGSVSKYSTTHSTPQTCHWATSLSHSHTLNMLLFKAKTPQSWAWLLSPGERHGFNRRQSARNCDNLDLYVEPKWSQVFLHSAIKLYKYGGYNSACDSVLLQNRTSHFYQN